MTRKIINDVALTILLINVINLNLPSLGSEKESSVLQYGTWTNMNPAGPAPRYGHAMAYDAESDRVILFGGYIEGYGYDDETWAYDYNSNTWTNMIPSIRPSARYHHAMAYDSESDKAILFGGYFGGYFYDDTWVYNYNNNTWTYMNPATRPSSRFGHAMVYNSKSDKIVLFGGETTPSDLILDDTWTYDLNTNAWAKVTTATKPTARYQHAMAYDVQSDKAVMFGGWRGERYTTRLDDTLTYTYNTSTWAYMAVPTKPLGRSGHAMSYDFQSDRAMLFGGYSGSAYLEDTWEYDFDTNTWTNTNPSTKPTPRQWHALAYDSESDKVILFGGQTSPLTCNGETWAYNSPVTPDFSMSISPQTQAIPQSSTGTYNITLYSQNRFTGRIVFSVSGLPSEAIGNFNPNPVDLLPSQQTNSTLVVSTGSSAPLGAYTFLIRGTAGGLMHEINATLIVGTEAFSLSVNSFKNDYPVISNITLFGEKKTVIATANQVFSYEWILPSETYYVQAEILNNHFIHLSNQICVDLKASTELAIKFLFGNLTVSCVDSENRPLINCTVSFKRENEERLRTTDNLGSATLEAYYGMWNIKTYWMGVPVGEANIVVDKSRINVIVSCKVGDFAVIVVNQYGTLIKSNVTLFNSTYSLFFSGCLDGTIENITFVQISQINYELVIQGDQGTHTYTVDTSQTRLIRIESVEVIKTAWFEIIIYIVAAASAGFLLATVLMRRKRK